MNTVKEIFEPGSFSTLEEGIETLLQLARGLMDGDGEIDPMLVMQKTGFKNTIIALLAGQDEIKKGLKKIIKAFRPEATFLFFNSDNRIKDEATGSIVEMCETLVCRAQTAHSSLVAMQPYTRKLGGSFAWGGIKIYRDSDAIISELGKFMSHYYQQTTSVTES